MPFVKISGLTTATAVSATNQLEVNQNGASRSVTLSQVAAYVQGTITPAAISAVPVGPVTSSGLTMTTARLLGRTSASSGAIEEIAAGSRISLAAGTISFDASGTFAFDSGYGSVATVYGCRAWVNFNGTGTIAIRASGNVSSITDNGVGSYIVNLTTAMPDANFTAVAGVGFDASNNAQSVRVDMTLKTASTQTVVTHAGTGSNTDSNNVNVAIFR